MEYLAPRIATLDDVATLVHQRAEMFAEIGHPRDAIFETMVSRADSWFRRHITAGTYIGFLIAQTGNDPTPVAGGGALFFDWPPTRDSEPLRGYILNVYVEPPHRRRGLARIATEACIDACRARGIRTIALHAAPAGRGIYERLGFVPTNEMRLELFDGALEPSRHTSDPGHAVPPG